MDINSRFLTEFKAKKFKDKATTATIMYTLIGFAIGMVFLTMFSGFGDGDVGCFILVICVSYGFITGVRKERKYKVRADIYRTMSTMETEIKHLHQKLNNVPVAQPFSPESYFPEGLEQATISDPPVVYEDETVTIIEESNEIVASDDDVEEEEVQEEEVDVQEEGEREENVVGEEKHKKEEEEEWDEEEMVRAENETEAPSVISTSLPPDPPSPAQYPDLEPVTPPPIFADHSSVAEDHPVVPESESKSHETEVPEERIHVPQEPSEPIIRPSINEGFPRKITCPYCNHSLEIVSIGNFICPNCDKFGRVDEYGIVERE